MHIALNLDVEVKDGTLVLTDHTGQTITFSKEQTVQKNVSMMTLGELCGLPKRQLATGFGFKTRKASDESRNAVLQGSPADLVPKRRGPRSPLIRTKEREALIIRTRFATEGNMEAIADTLTQMDCPVRARLVGQVLADYGLSKKNGCPLSPSPLACSPTRKSKPSTAPGSRVYASSPSMPSSMTSRRCAHVASRPQARVASSSFPPSSNWASRTSWRLEDRPNPKDSRMSVWLEVASLSRSLALLLAFVPSIRSAVPTWAFSLACLFSPRRPPNTGSCSLFRSQAPWSSRPPWAPVWSHSGTSRPGTPSTSMPTT